MDKFIDRLSGTDAILASFTVFILGVLADTLTTSKIVAIDGVRESNPIIRTVLEQSGTLGILSFKLLLCGLLIGLITLVYPREKCQRTLVISGFVVGGIWLLAAIWNLQFVL